jgi:hypothetical protein
MPKVVHAARVTVTQSAVWRTCSRCGQLAPLPPEIDRCPACEPLCDPAAALTAVELDEARAELTKVCRSCRTRLERIHAINAYLTGYLGSLVAAVMAREPYITGSLRRAYALYTVREQVTR